MLASHDGHELASHDGRMLASHDQPIIFPTGFTWKIGTKKYCYLG
jgi:hypothetical protein